MLRSVRRLALCAGAGALLVLPAAAGAEAHSHATGLGARHACSAAKIGHASCGALVVTKDGKAFHGRTAPGESPAGYHPADLQSAYSLPSSTAGSGQTIALVDAYNQPDAVTDINAYRSEFGLPAASTCTVVAGKIHSPGGPCFVQTNQSGSTTGLPQNDPDWGLEESLDIEMASAICPNCNVVLVEANTSSITDLGKAVNEAVSLGAKQISNSYSGSDTSEDSALDNAFYKHKGVAITASSGDDGYGTGYPATSPYVTAVGGTSLYTASNARGWTETAWSGAGSGCSPYEPQAPWQTKLTDVPTVCSTRAVSDVSAVADPDTGVTVYDTYDYGGYLVVGGTSVSSPIIASVYALAGNASSDLYGDLPYLHQSDLYDITTGSNGSCGSIMCNAASGWDGPTGLGTPDGDGAF